MIGVGQSIEFILLNKQLDHQSVFLFICLSIFGVHDRVMLFDYVYDELRESIHSADEYKPDECIDEKGAGKESAVHSRTVQLD